jgi:hypothetical protein
VLGKDAQRWRGVNGGSPEASHPDDDPDRVDLGNDPDQVLLVRIGRDISYTVAIVGDELDGLLVDGGASDQDVAAVHAFLAIGTSEDAERGYRTLGLVLPGPEVFFGVLLTAIF